MKKTIARKNNCYPFAAICGVLAASALMTFAIPNSTLLAHASEVVQECQEMTQEPEAAPNEMPSQQGDTPSQESETPSQQNEGSSQQNESPTQKDETPAGNPDDTTDDTAPTAPTEPAKDAPAATAAQPAIHTGDRYDPSGVICNDSNQVITITFQASDGANGFSFDLDAGGGRHQVQSQYTGGGVRIATKDYWVCRSVNGTHYVFTANTPDVPAQQTAAKTQTAKKEQPKHVCNMEWVTVKEPTMKTDGLTRYQCKSCGKVEMEVPISAATTYITKLYSAVDKAVVNGIVTYDAEDYYTISKYVLQKMAQRNDVTVAITFNYKNASYVIVFPAKTDYTQLLAGKAQFYGFMGLNGYNGIAVAPTVRK